MNQTTIAHLRLVNQQIARQRFERPGDLVRWLGAAQAQDYLGALWALGLRTPGATEAVVEQAIADRTIVRTWPMRGTIHFVPPEDARWMLELMTPRVVQGLQRRLRELDIDAATLATSEKVVVKALEGGRQLTRNQLRDELEAAGVATAGSRGLHILGQLAHRQLICFGARAGKQPTFTLLEAWAPEARQLPRDEALATMALRYFSSHGPATVQDFVWWTGLTVADARAGLAAVAGQLTSKQIDGREYFMPPELASDAVDPGRAFLLPPFDEFLVAYRDRSASLDPSYANLVVPGGNGIFNPIVVIDGRVSGSWKRAFKKDTVTMTFSPFTGWSAAERRAIEAAADEYGRYVGKAAAPMW
jgi:hypothetical protein